LFIKRCSTPLETLLDDDDDYDYDGQWDTEIPNACARTL
jgi:hypothetical protein